MSDSFAALWTVRLLCRGEELGSSVRGILQARMLEWVAISSPEDLPNPGIEPVTPATHSRSVSAMFCVSWKVVCPVDV